MARKITVWLHVCLCFSFFYFLFSRIDIDDGKNERKKNGLRHVKLRKNLLFSLTNNIIYIIKKSRKKEKKEEKWQGFDRILKLCEKNRYKNASHVSYENTNVFTFFFITKKGIRLYLKSEEKKQDHTSGITIYHITFYESRSTNSYYMHTWACFVFVFICRLPSYFSFLFNLQESLSIKTTRWKKYEDRARLTLVCSTCMSLYSSFSSFFPSIVYVVVLQKKKIYNKHDVNHTIRRRHQRQAVRITA
jgi:hypothetical protein